MIPLMRLVVALVLLCVTSACGSGLRLSLKPFYANARLDDAAAETRLDVPYRTDRLAHAEKHRLDLFLPRGRGWPMLAFVHGGSLEKGDTAQQLIGNDFYRNIGRFYAARGVGVALINYRLQPEVNWVGQVDDVADAVAWLTPRLESLGGDGRMFLSGHSVGSWLVSRVALDAEVQARHGVAADAISGVISISGSGFDLTDELTWELFGREKRWQRRFSVEPGEPDWKQHASVIPLLSPQSPPFVLIYAGDEWPALQRQNRLMCDALAITPAGCSITEIEGLGHRRMVLAISHADKPLAPRILEVLGVPAAAE